MAEPQLIRQKVKTQDEVKDMLEQIKLARTGNWIQYGRDGAIELWRKTYVYRNVKYEIACVKYFSFNESNPLDARVLGMDKYLILEYTEDEAQVADMLKSFNLYNEWLYNDTCRTEFQGISLEDQEKYLHERAKEDVDFLLDKAVPTLKKKVAELERKIRELERALTEVKR
jgi:hypothetical protein